MLIPSRSEKSLNTLYWNGCMGAIHLPWQSSICGGEVPFLKLRLCSTANYFFFWQEVGAHGTAIQHAS